MRRLGLALLLLALPATAEVRYPSGTISWSAPHECPREDDLVDEIERLLGQPLSVARKQELILSGRVTGSPTEGYAVTLQVTSADGSYERNLQHASCVKLTEGAALVMALAIDPERVSAQSRAALEPPKPAETAKPVVAAPPPAPRPPEALQGRRLVSGHAHPEVPPAQADVNGPLARDAERVADRRRVRVRNGGHQQVVRAGAPPDVQGVHRVDGAHQRAGRQEPARPDLGGDARVRRGATP